MLKPSQCFVGPITQGIVMTMLLPRDDEEERMLLCKVGGKKYAVMLESDFITFERDQNDTWKGVHIPDVHIEIDPVSIRTAKGFRNPLGSLIRHETYMSISGQRSPGGPVSQIPLLDNLSPCAEGYSAAFLSA
ncbi:hypothetical protein [Sphingobium sp. MK2]|uniref:hypothetical protein n=1 Tax=Sphingobium sp. MK2 TaxID=3116540 RepID=UPI0032E35CAB